MNDFKQYFLYDVPVVFTKNTDVFHEYRSNVNYFTSELALSTQPLDNGQFLVKASRKGFHDLLNNFHKIFVMKPSYILLYIDEKAGIADFMQDTFCMRYAAGGVVCKNKKVLMIKRLGKWDLPKGTIEVGEATDHAAIREVAEECNVQASIHYKLCLTGHNYTHEGMHFFKQITWYKMHCITDENMAPQSSEAITEVAWMDSLEQLLAAENSYRSIGYVLAAYKKKLLFRNRLNYNLFSASVDIH